MGRSDRSPTVATGIDVDPSQGGPDSTVPFGDPVERRQGRATMTGHEGGCVAEVELPAGSVFFAETLAAVSGLVAEVTLVGRFSDRATSYLYLRGSGLEEVDDRAAEDPTVSSIERLDTNTQGGLYRVDWSPPEDGVLAAFPDGEVTILQAMGYAGNGSDTARWEMTLRFGSRDGYETFTTTAIRERLDWQLTRTYWPRPLPTTDR